MFLISNCCSCCFCFSRTIFFIGLSSHKKLGLMSFYRSYCAPFLHTPRGQVSERVWMKLSSLQRQQNKKKILRVIKKYLRFTFLASASYCATLSINIPSMENCEYRLEREREIECKVQTWTDAWRHESDSTRQKWNKINLPRLTSRKIITS